MSAGIILSIQFILACDENKSIMFNQYGNIKMDWLQRGFQKVPIMYLNFLSIHSSVLDTQDIQNWAFNDLHLSKMITQKM